MKIALLKKIESSIFSLILILPALLIGQAIPSHSQSSDDLLISPETVLNYKKEQPASIVILDVRKAADWETSQYKIAGAVRPDFSALDSWKSLYGTDRTIIVYCS